MVPIRDFHFIKNGTITNNDTGTWEEKCKHKEKFFWIKIISKNNGNFEEFQESWEKVISRTPVRIVKQLALAVCKFFEENDMEKNIFSWAYTVRG